MKAMEVKTMAQKLQEARDNVERLEAISYVMEEVQRQKDYCRDYVLDEETGARIENEDGSGYLKRDPEPGDWHYMQYKVWDMIEKYLLDC